MFTGSAAGNQGRESEHGGVHLAFIGGPFAFAGALQFGLHWVSVVVDRSVKPTSCLGSQ